METAEPWVMTKGNTSDRRNCRKRVHMLSWLWCFKKAVKVTVLLDLSFGVVLCVCVCAHWYIVSGCWATLFITSIFARCRVLLSPYFFTLTLRLYLNISVPHLLVADRNTTPLPLHLCVCVLQYMFLHACVFLCIGERTGLGMSMLMSQNTYLNKRLCMSVRNLQKQYAHLIYTTVHRFGVCILIYFLFRDTYLVTVNSYFNL